jgi:NifB/MoaA-like Fe-S oxidoreductase
VQVRVLPVRNGFFGPSVTVAGLLTGRDILRALRGKRLGDIVLLPRNILRDDDGLFLDELSLEDVERAAGVPVRPVRRFRDMVEALKEPIARQ